MKLQSTFLFVLLSLLTNAQVLESIDSNFNGNEKITESYYVLKSDGKTKHGRYWITGKQNVPRIEGQYKNGKREGTWIRYFSKTDDTLVIG